MSASSRLDLNTNQIRNDETCNEEDVEHGDFPALRPCYDRKAPTHYNIVVNWAFTFKKIDPGLNIENNSYLFTFECFVDMNLSRGLLSIQCIEIT